MQIGTTSSPLISLCLCRTAVAIASNLTWIFVVSGNLFPVQTHRLWSQVAPHFCNSPLLLTDDYRTQQLVRVGKSGGSCKASHFSIASSNSYAISKTVYVDGYKVGYGSVLCR